MQIDWNVTPSQMNSEMYLTMPQVWSVVSTSENIEHLIFQERWSSSIFFQSVFINERLPTLLGDRWVTKVRMSGQPEELA